MPAREGFSMNTVLTNAKIYYRDGTTAEYTVNTSCRKKLFNPTFIKILKDQENDIVKIEIEKECLTVNRKGE